MKIHCIAVTIYSYKETTCAALLLTQTWQVSLSEKAEIVDICRFPPLRRCRCRLTGPVESIKAERAFSNFVYIKACIMQLSQSSQHLKKIGWDEWGALCNPGFAAVPGINRTPVVKYQVTHQTAPVCHGILVSVHWSFWKSQSAPTNGTGDIGIFVSQRIFKLVRCERAGNTPG